MGKKVSDLVTRKTHVIVRIIINLYKNQQKSCIIQHIEDIGAAFACDRMHTIPVNSKGGIWKFSNYSIWILMLPERVWILVWEKDLVQDPVQGPVLDPEKEWDRS